MIPFDMHIIAETANEPFNPHLIHGSLGPPKSTLQSASRSLQLSQSSQMWLTDRHTADHTTLSPATGY